MRNPRQALVHAQYVARVWYLRLIETPEGWLFDRLNGVRTSGRIEHDRLDGISSLEHATWYEPVELRYLRSSVRRFSRTFGNDFHFIDIGCGEGRACFYAAGLFRSVVGVDFSPTLVARAASNARSFRNRRGCEIGFCVADAADYRLPRRRSAVFLYNPFDETILSKFIQDNADVLREQNSYIIYVNSVHSRVLDDAGFVLCHRRNSYLPVSIYRCG
ncbi:MAG: class I SAM-dependent methyltransferase [Beijerinckiaceae bacterium]